jgi:hypothetical protein
MQDMNLSKRPTQELKGNVMSALPTLTVVAFLFNNAFECPHSALTYMLGGA